MTDARTFRGTTTIDAPPERVHDAISTLAGVRGWWSPIVTGSLEPGRDFHLGFEGLEETIRLTVLRSDDQCVEWQVREHTSAPDWDGSRIAFRLRAGNGGCTVVLEHSDVEADGVAPGWDHFLDSLRSLVERGKGRPYLRVVEDALSVALRYHRAWTGRRFEEAVALLAEALETEVPINTYASRAEWARALVGFGGIVDRADLVCALGDADQAVLVYDMVTEPYGVLRIAEHFTVRDGTIVRIRHVHDTAPLREAMVS